MGLLDRPRQAIAPAPAHVADAQPPDDPNALASSGVSRDEGPSIYINRRSGAGTPADTAWWSAWRYPRALKEKQRESFLRDALVRRGLALKAEAATGEGWRADVKTDDASVDVTDTADEIQDYEDRKQISLGAKIQDALLRADLHRFSIILLGIEDGAEVDGSPGLTDFSEPVDLKTIRTITWARVFDARDVRIKGFHNLDSDEYAQPTKFIITDAQGAIPEGLRSDKRNEHKNAVEVPLAFPDGVAQIEVDASRCLFFTAPDGIPVPDSMQWHFANYFSAQSAVARGASDYSIGVYKIKNWDWKARNRDQASSIERVTAMDRMKSMYNALILDADNEEYSRLGGGAVAGLEKMVNPAMVDIAAALGVSITLFWGISPGGFSQGKSETKNFNASIRVGQNLKIAPELRKFHTYVLVAADGPQIDIKPESREIVFNDLDPAGEEETQGILSKRAADIFKAFELTLLGIDEARESLEALNTPAFSFKIKLPPATDGTTTTALPGPNDPAAATPEPVEVVEEDEPDELEVAFSNDPLPSDAGTARDLAAELSERLGRKIPTGRVTKLARPGPGGEAPQIRSWNMLGGAPLHSLREVMTIIARANGLMPEPPANTSDQDMPTIELVVTRHKPLVTYLIEQGIVSSDTPVIEHATAEDVAGKHVIGVLPHHLSSKAASVTEVPMNMTLEDRQAAQSGDLALERVREIAGTPVTYIVQATSV